MVRVQLVEDLLIDDVVGLESEHLRQQLVEEFQDVLNFIKNGREGLSMCQMWALWLRLFIFLTEFQIGKVNIYAVIVFNFNWIALLLFLVVILQVLALHQCFSTVSQNQIPRKKIQIYHKEVIQIYLRVFIVLI